MGLNDLQVESIVCTAILNYLNTNRYTKEDILIKFPEAVELGCLEFKSTVSQPSNVVSMTQGARSITFKEGSNILTDNVKLLLPKPSNFMVW